MKKGKRQTSLQGENEWPFGRRTDGDDFYRLLAENTRDVLFMQDMDLRIAYVSPSVKAHFGYTPQEAMCLTMKDIMTPESFYRAVESFRLMVPLARERGDIDIPLMEYEYIRKDGSSFWGELKVRFLFTEENGPIGSQGVMRNIQKRREMEVALRESEAKFRNLFELSPLPILLTDLDTGTLLDTNSMFSTLTSYSKGDVIGRKTTDLGFYTSGDQERFVRMLKTHGEIRGLQVGFRTKHGKVFDTILFSRQIAVGERHVMLSVFYDMTEKKRLEEQLRHSRKMEAVGNLAGAVAHDFNNLLTGVLGNISLMLLDTAEEDDRYSLLRDTEKLALNGSKLTHQLLGYSRKGKLEVRVIDLNTLVRENVQSFGRTHTQIAVRFEPDPGVLAVEADSSQIEQALLNLLLNAADAMPGGGDLVLRTGRLTDKDMEGRAYNPREGTYGSLEIEDTGEGMDEETLQRIFEPFFTTKAMGKGTGLGLASVYGIIKGHGGYIDVASTPGRGTTCTICLPLSDKRPERREEAPGPVEKATGAILMVDDTESVLEVGSKILRRLGYRIFQANSGRKALEIYEPNKDDIDLVILDLVMPGMGGGETFDRIRAMDSRVRVLLTTAYTQEGEVDEILARGCDGFLQKPFRVEELSLKIKEILAREP